MKPSITLLTTIAYVAAFAACAPSPLTPDLGRLYNRVARDHTDLRNPVILIPGLMGSRLVDKSTGSVIWGSFGDHYADPERPEGARRIALPMRVGESLAGLVDSSRTDGSLDRMKVKVLGVPFAFDAYSDILTALGVGGYRSKGLSARGEVDYGEGHFTCFQFDYDWRRSSAENAQRLHDFILYQRAYVQKEIERRYGIADHDVHFDIVAHSMGSLVTRYYLRYGNQALPETGDIGPPTWAGAEFVDRAILVAPPNAGVPQMLLDLVNGKDFGFLLPRYSAAVLGTMPSLYELLPRPRHGQIVDASGQAIRSIYDVEFWKSMQWGLADPHAAKVLEWLLPEVSDAAQRRRIALDHLRKSLGNARRFVAALDIPAIPPAHLQIDLIAGDAVDTPNTLQVENRGVRVVATAPGDGTVLRSSALMDERLGGEWRPTLITPVRWRQVTFLFLKHMDLTKDPAFIDNMLYMLMESPRN